MCLNSHTQVCDIVVNAPIKSWLRLYKGDLNYANFQQFRRDFNYAASQGKALPQWQPPKVAGDLEGSGAPRDSVAHQAGIRGVQGGDSQWLD